LSRVAAGDAGLVIIDISDPAAARISNHLRLETAQAVAADAAPPTSDTVRARLQLSIWRGLISRAIPYESSSRAILFGILNSTPR
jgi:hypothetical protein